MPVVPSRFCCKTVLRPSQDSKRRHHGPVPRGSTPGPDLLYTLSLKGASRLSMSAVYMPRTALRTPSSP